MVYINSCKYQSLRSNVSGRYLYSRRYDKSYDSDSRRSFTHSSSYFTGSPIRYQIVNTLPSSSDNGTVAMASIDSDSGRPTTIKFNFIPTNGYLSTMYMYILKE